jgi:phosphoglycolate phosphatase-like HAD superfamily hydrolase
MQTIVLWDIDQTLLYTGGAGMKGMRRAFRDLYGVDDTFGRIEFSGRTDAAIFRDEALLQGFDAPRIASELPRFIDAYIPHLETAMREAVGGTLKPGVVNLLQALRLRDDVVQGLGTGNFRRAGESKLRFFEIDAYFPGCVGGFGEDSEDRHEVIAAGIDRLRNGGPAGRIVIIGDTPNDIAAAKANNAFALGVATGTHTVDDLLASGADAALPDLSNSEGAIEIICGA